MRRSALARGRWDNWPAWPCGHGAAAVISFVMIAMSAGLALLARILGIRD
jgi:hypothetical protein